MTGAAGLLQALEAVGVLVTLNAAGDGLKLKATTAPPAALLDEVRSSRAALIEALSQAKGVPDPPPLPAHLATLVDAAKAGKMRPGTAKLASGLVTDLGVYVLAWAECWPRDRAHTLRRLEEAYQAK